MSLRLPASRYAPAAVPFLLGAGATVSFCHSMSGGMAMPGGWTMSMAWMRMPGQTLPESIGMFQLMWLAMMVAMMLPSAAPIFVRGRPGSSPALVACGYFTVWLAAGLLVYVIGVAWAAAAMRWDGLGRTGPALCGAMLLAAGAFQFSRWKTAGLARCREPQGCCADKSARADTSGFVHGLHQGLSCCICCAGPMLALLALGIMNLAAMAAIAAVIGLEKLLPNPRPVVQATGIFGVAGGSVLFLRALLR